MLPDNSPVYKGNFYKRLKIVDSPELNTVFALGNLDPNREINSGLLYLHGLGMGYSHVGSTYTLLDLIMSLGNISQQQAASKYAKHLVYNNHITQYTLKHLSTMLPMAVDLPGTGLGAHPDQVNNLDGVVKYFRSVISRSFEFLPENVPLNIVARSASSPILMEVLKEPIPRLGKIFLIGATHPAFDVEAKTIETIMKEAVNHSALANLFGLRWFLKSIEEFQFYKNESHLRETFENNDIHFFIGDKDQEVTDQSRQEYLNWSKLYGAKFHRFDAGHDVLAMPRDSKSFEDTAGIHREFFGIISE